MRIYVYYRHEPSGNVSTDEYRSLRGILRATSRRVARVTRRYNLEDLAHKKIIIADQKGVSYEDVASVIAYAPRIWSENHDSLHPDRNTDIADRCIQRALTMKAEEGIIFANDAMVKAITPLINPQDLNSQLQINVGTDSVEFPIIWTRFSGNKDVFNSFQYKATAHAVNERYGVLVHTGDNSRGWNNLYVSAPHLTRR